MSVYPPTPAPLTLALSPEGRGDFVAPVTGGVA